MGWAMVSGFPFPVEVACLEVLLSRSAFRLHLNEFKDFHTNLLEERVSRPILYHMY